MSILRKWRRAFPKKSSKPLIAAATITATVLLFIWLFFSWGTNMRPLTPSAEFARMNQSTLLSTFSNLKSTLRCHISAKPSHPVLQYVVVLDAGSTGSRVHVYRFNYCATVPKLENEIFESVKPGLSTYVDDPFHAAASLRPLMDIAVRGVPEGLRGCTPVAVKATAGLRLLGETNSNQILTEVRKLLVNEYPFALAGHDAVGILDGASEGVYAWITVNFLLNNLGQARKLPTAATMDLGGGSTQIVFEPEFPQRGGMEPGEHRYELTFAGHHYLLYQHSYLGYGLKEARRRVKQASVDGILKTASAKSAGSVIESACVRRFAQQTFDYPGASGTASCIIHGTANDMNKCHNVVRSTLFSRVESCQVKPCSFDGVYQPPLSSTFPHGDIYAFSYIYDRVTPLLRGMGSMKINATLAGFSLDDLKGMTDWTCSRADTDSNLEGIYAVNISDEDKRLVLKNADYCLDLTYIYALLHDGYALKERRRVQTAKKIADVETSWCLGAALALLDEGHMCRIEEI